MQPTRYMAIFFGPTRLRLTAIAFSTAVLAGCAAQQKEKITWNAPRVTPPAEAATTAPSDLPSDGKLRDKTLQDALDKSAGGPCREFQESVIIDGKTQRAYGTACRQPDGTWKIVNS